MIIKRHADLWLGSMVDGHRYVKTEGEVLPEHIQKLIAKDDIFECAKRGESITWVLNDGRKMTLAPEQILDNAYIIMTTGPEKSKIEHCPSYHQPCYTFYEDEPDSNK